MIPSPMVIPGLKTPEEIAAEIWNITTDQLYQRTRKVEVVEARSTLVYYRNQKLKQTQAKSAGEYGLEHSSTDSIVKRVNRWLKVDKSFTEKFETFNSKLS
jgi:chromosomal replication initiation ATPase DnaA